MNRKIKAWEKWIPSSYDLSLFKTDAEGCIKPNVLSIVGENNVSINENVTPYLAQGFSDSVTCAYSLPFS